VLASIGKVLESYSSCPSSISQAAAVAALRGPQDCVREMVAGYRHRRDLVVDELDGTDLLLHVPEGAFYAMIGTARAGVSSRDFAFGLLREHQVSVAPGSAFGSCDDAVRISLAGSPDDLSEGLSRLRRYTTTLEGLVT
jgi:aspartate/methionine/tyrosine aminotransferase